MIMRPKGNSSTATCHTRVHPAHPYHWQTTAAWCGDGGLARSTSLGPGLPRWRGICGLYIYLGIDRLFWPPEDSWMQTCNFRRLVAKACRQCDCGVGCDTGNFKSDSPSFVYIALQIARNAMRASPPLDMRRFEE